LFCTYSLEKNSGDIEMGKYYISNTTGTLTSTGIINNNGNGTNPNTSMCGCYCPSSTTFLSTLTDKLLEMAQSLKEQFAALEANSNSTLQKAKGVIIAEITTQGSITTKWEYVLYIQIYGPPVQGQFDPVYLELIRGGIADGSIQIPS